jgi:hypothetical protein
MTFKPVPPVDPKYLTAAHDKVVADRETYGSPDVMVSVVSLFNKRLEPKAILDITHRLFALSNFIENGKAKDWITDSASRDYILVDEGVLRAAARAPLMEAEYIKDMCFAADTFMPIVLEECETEGKA